MSLHRVRISSTGYVDPHVNVVVTHCIGQDQVEFFLSDQVENLGPFSSRLHNLRKGRRRQREQRREKK